MSWRMGIPAALAVVALVGCGSSSSKSSSTPAAGSTTGAQTAPQPSASARQIGFEGVSIESGPLLAPASTTGTSPADGIQCGPIEQLFYHIHAHLQVYLDGTPRALPAGIGIPGSVTQDSARGPVAVGGQCIYWLHTHAPDGVIHIESPTQRIYSLGNFFDVWRQPLARDRVGALRGHVTAYVNGKPWSASPRGIPLLPHAVIQLDVGAPTPSFQPVNWSQTQL